MNRFVIASALGIIGALGFANTADAQYVYGYRTYVPGAGVVVRSQTYATPFGAQRCGTAARAWCRRESSPRANAFPRRSHTVLRAG